MLRFSETNKWNDEWFCDLKPLQKLVFLFLVDRCDNAGFMEINTRINSFLIGVTPEQYEGAIKGLDKCLIKSHDGKKLWIVNFLKHQKNLPLNFENNAHKQILFLIEENKKKFDFDFESLGANKGLNSPLGKGNSKGNGTGNGNEGGSGETLENWEYEKKSFLKNEGWMYRFCTEKKVDLDALKILMNDWINNIELKEDFKTAKELRNHFTNYFDLEEKKQKNGKKSFNGSAKQQAASNFINSARDEYEFATRGEAFN
jgi:hypothetical protein